MSLISNLQDDLSNSSIKLASALSKALVLAYRLNSEELRTWVDSEVNGYTTVDVPPYWRLPASPHGNFMNSAWRHNNVAIQPSEFPEGWRQSVTEQIFTDGISGFESLLEGSKENIKIELPPELAIFLSNKVYDNLACTSVWKQIGRFQIINLIETVRNRLLKFTLELERKFPDVAKNDDKLGDVPAETVQATVTNYIFGGQNVIAAGSNFTQNVHSVQQGNMASLIEALRRIGLDRSEIQELKLAIEDDGPQSEAKKFGNKVTSFLGKLATKAVDSATSGAVSTTVAKALAFYFGWGAS